MPFVPADQLKGYLSQNLKPLDDITKEVFDATFRLERDMELVGSFLREYRKFRYDKLPDALSETPATNATAPGAVATGGGSAVGKSSTAQNLNNIVKVANKLDSLGMTIEADLLDQVVLKMAGEPIIMRELPPEEQIKNLMDRLAIRNKDLTQYEKQINFMSELIPQLEPLAGSGQISIDTLDRAKQDLADNTERAAEARLDIKSLDREISRLNR